SAECRVQSAELRACFQFITLHSALITSFVDSFDDDVRAESRDDEAVAHVEAAGERGLVLRLGLPGLVIPELAVGAVAVPAEVAVGDRLQREELEAAQQTVPLRHLHAPAQNLNRDEPLVRV